MPGLTGERYFLKKLGLQCWLGWYRILTKRLKVTAVLSGWLRQYVPPDRKVRERKTPSSTKGCTLHSFALVKTSRSLSDLLFFPLLYPPPQEWRGILIFVTLNCNSYSAKKTHTVWLLRWCVRERDILATPNNQPTLGLGQNITQCSKSEGREMTGTGFPRCDVLCGPTYPTVSHVCHSTEPVPKWHHHGHARGDGKAMQSQCTVSLTAPKNACIPALLGCNTAILWMKLWWSCIPSFHSIIRKRVCSSYCIVFIFIHLYGIWLLYLCWDIQTLNETDQTITLYLLPEGLAVSSKIKI